MPGPPGGRVIAVGTAGVLGGRITVTVPARGASRLAPGRVVGNAPPAVTGGVTVTGAVVLGSGVMGAGALGTEVVGMAVVGAGVALLPLPLLPLERALAPLLPAPPLLLVMPLPVLPVPVAPPLLATGSVVVGRLPDALSPVDGELGGGRTAAVTAGKVGTVEGAGAAVALLTPP